MIQVDNFIDISKQKYYEKIHVTFTIVDEQTY